MLVDDIQRYEICYTQTATEDIEEKSDYIAFELHDPSLAETWYFRLRELIQDNLTTFPLKYSLYDVSPWREQGIRLFTTRNDVVLYSVDTDNYIVCIRAVCTKGRDLPAHLAVQEQEDSQ